MNTRHLTIATLILLTSCNVKDNKEKLRVTPVSFPKTVNIDYQELPTDYLMGLPQNMTLTEKYIILLDRLHGQKHSLHALDRDSGKLEFEFLTKGNGPCEISLISFDNFLQPDSQKIQYYDMNHKQFLYFDINSRTIDCRSTLRLWNKDKIWPIAFFDMGTYYMGAGRIAEKGEWSKSRIVTFNKSFDPIGFHEEEPVLSYNDEENKKLIEHMFYMYFCKIRPDKKRMVFASFLTGIMEIYNLESAPDSIRIIKRMLLTPLMKEEDNIHGFEDAYVTDKYIYAPHSGKTRKELNLAQNIKVFDWNGEPIIEMNVGIGIRCFAVDEKRRKIYAVALPEDKEYILITMDLPEI
ncbi:MAG: TolB-like 6-bladed beta-propeller domain-containing protein [Bacteroidales bacterium]|jgi:hypothetical protein|nr:TolB-like 6-bladed beta-propeller domain-containing protein [Bacteroidales bacterium]